MLALVLLLACGGGSAPVAEPPAEVAAAPAAPPPAGDTLVVGTLLLDPVTPTFTPCVEGGARPADPIGPLADEVRKLLPEAGMAYVELAAVPGEGGLQVQRVDVAVVEGIGCSVTGAAWTWRLFGTEPFWALELDAERATYKDADGRVLVATVTGVPTQPGGFRLEATGGDALVLEVAPGRCSDGMSDAVYAYTASVTLPDRTVKGCARRKP